MSYMCDRWHALTSCNRCRLIVRGCHSFVSSPTHSHLLTWRCCRWTSPLWTASEVVPGSLRQGTCKSSPCTWQALHPSCLSAYPLLSLAWASHALQGLWSIVKTVRHVNITCKCYGTSYLTLSTKLLSLRVPHVMYACIGGFGHPKRLVNIKMHLLSEALIFDLWYCRSLHILVCNAAVFGVPFQLSEDRLEMHFATNHLGHFYLVQLLRETLIKSAPARVVVVSSESHRLLQPRSCWQTLLHNTLLYRYTDLEAASLNLCSLQKPNKADYHAITAYGTSKLCNMLFGLELNRIMCPVGVTCNIVHPGNLLSTNMLRNAGILYNLLRMVVWPFVKSVVSEPNVCKLTNKYIIAGVYV